MLRSLHWRICLCARMGRYEIVHLWFYVCLCFIIIYSFTYNQSIFTHHATANLIIYLLVQCSYQRNDA